MTIYCISSQPVPRPDQAEHTDPVLCQTSQVFPGRVKPDAHRSEVPGHGGARKTHGSAEVLHTRGEHIRESVWVVLQVVIVGRGRSEKGQ